MPTLIFEHIPVAELPAAWQVHLRASGVSRVTVRIEEEPPASEAHLAQNPLFGMWRDHPDMQDVEDRMSRVRRPRFTADGSRIEG